MTLKNDEKSEEELTCQNWNNKFDEFWLLEHSNVSKIYTSMGYFWPKYIMFELRKYKRVTFDGIQDWYKI